MRGVNKALSFTTSDPNDWTTPKSFYELLAQEFGGFDVVPAQAYPVFAAIARRLKEVEL